MAQIPPDLYKEFFQLVERGDETAAKEFLVTNLKKFPQETQDAIITAFVEEALMKKNQGDKAVLDFQKKGIQMMDVLGEGKEELEKKLKLLKLKETL